ncbi:helix-turn-helix domain-containing protein [Streptomyces sp. NPDC087787]|uniref:helix-turn-helix domain-containing protein n=1 Tax=Streptomyces sp. NPDC087787 TaxID=3365803 RepID=UPI00380164D7
MLVTEFSTETVAPPERFALWEEFSGRSHVRDLLRSENQNDFRARMRILHLGDLQVSALAMPHLHVVRTSRSVRQFDPEVYQVNCAVSGGGRVTTAGRDAEFHAGQTVLADSSHPMKATLHNPSHGWTSFVIQLPRALLPLPEKTVRRLISVPVPGGQGMGGVFHRWVADLHRRAHEFTPADVPTLASVTTDLLVSTLSRCLDAEDALSPQARRRALGVQIRDFVEQHLDDPGLTPQAVADAHHISLRHLQQLLADDGTSPAAWIRQRRLESCRRDLADPRLVMRPIQDIAARWGFTDSAHFSRLFRAAYGMPPSDYRRPVLDRSVQESTTTVR